MIPQSGVFTLTFLGLRLCSLTSKGNKWVRVIVSWPSNQVCLLCLSLSVWSNLRPLPESWLGPSPPFTPYLFHKEFCNLRTIRWVHDMRLRHGAWMCWCFHAFLIFTSGPGKHFIICFRSESLSRLSLRGGHIDLTEKDSLLLYRWKTDWRHCTCKPRLDS